MKAALALALLLPALAACDFTKTPEGEGPDAGAEQAQDRQPPVERLNPQPISFTDIEQNQFFGAGCAFVPEAGEGLDPVLYTIGKRGLLKLDGKMIVLAAATDSAEFPYGTRDAYVGGGHLLNLTKGGGEGQVAGEESVSWPGSLTIRDPSGEVDYQSSGKLECGA